MPTTYVGVSNFNPSITIPVDGDLADANSVNVSAKDELDTQINLFESYGQLMQSTSPLRVRFSSLNSIDVDPIPFIALTEGGTWKTTFTTTTTNVSDADLEGGGVFASTLSTAFCGIFIVCGKTPVVPMYEIIYLSFILPSFLLYIELYI